MQSTLVLLIVGLSPSLLGVHTPHLRRLAQQGGMRSLETVLPAVTCSVQSTLVTGLPPSGHGAVANGWYFRDLAEVWLWRQSNRLIGGEKIWEAARKRDPDFTCAKMFWWFNMYAGADWSATPRPMYPADGRKIPDHYTFPPELHDELDQKFGPFPLFNFWGPASSITSSTWIANATLHVMATRRPTLTLCYLPHLDYVLQRHGPNLASLDLQRDLSAVDALAGELIEAAKARGSRIIVVSEYGITPVQEAVHVNRALRRAGMIAVRQELGREILDPGASTAFALADHQIAHVYVQDPERVDEVKAVLQDLRGIERILDQEEMRAAGLDHPRSGELVLVARADCWFSYYYWLDDERAPDFARTVDIHRKPGYDPLELFVDPTIRLPSAAIAWRLLKRKLGQRALLDVISLKATDLVKGSHGRLTDNAADGPLVISSEPGLLPAGNLKATGFKQLVLDHLFAKTA